MRKLLASATALLVTTAACSSDGDDGRRADPTIVTTPSTSEAALEGLAVTGEHECEDREGDLTTSVRDDVPPLRDLPGIDLVRASVSLDEEVLTAEFETVGGITTEGGPIFVVSIGQVTDVNGFELRARAEEGEWVLEVRRAGGDAGGEEVAAAQITVSGARLEFEVPVDLIPLIQPNMPVLYGTSADVAGQAAGEEDGEQGGEEDGARAFDDCLDFVR